MIVKEKETKSKIKAKGILRKIDKDGLHIEDEKSEDIDILKFSDFEIFLDKGINFSVADSVKEDMGG